MALSRHGHRDQHHNTQFSARPRFHNSEAQPHLYGAAPFQFRAGIEIADVNKPPPWQPEMAYRKDYPYTLEEWLTDLRRWMAATKLSEQRKGPLVSLSVGGAARIVLDELDEETLINGVRADLNDGQGLRHHSGVDCIIRILRLKFPENLEARMLRAGLDFFSFCPRQGEVWEVLFLRFDVMLAKADSVAELQISWPFKAWMLMSLLRLPTRKWSSLLKDMNHHFPRTEAQYKELQNMILRERALETQVLQPGSSAGNTYGDGTYLLDTVSGNPVPLYMCLGNPCQSQEEHFYQPSAYHAAPLANSSTSPCEIDDFPDSSDSSGSEYWDEENGEDPWPADRLEEERNKARADPTYITQCFWAMRKAVRKYRAVKGKFGPRRRFQPRKLGKRFTRRGPGGEGNKPRKGSFVGECFVSMEHVPDSTLEAFFQGRSGKGKEKGGRPTNAGCFKCGRPGHLAKDCREPQPICFRCKRPGHRMADCPNPSAGTERAQTLWGTTNEVPTTTYFHRQGLVGKPCEPPDYMNSTCKPCDPYTPGMILMLNPVTTDHTSQQKNNPYERRWTSRVEWGNTSNTNNDTQSQTPLRTSTVTIEDVTTPSTQPAASQVPAENLQTWETHNIGTAEWDNNTIPVGTKVSFWTMTEGIIVDRAEDGNYLIQLNSALIKPVDPTLIIETMASEQQEGNPPEDAWQTALDQGYDPKPKPRDETDAWQNYTVSN